MEMDGRNMKWCRYLENERSETHEISNLELAWPDVDRRTAGVVFIFLCRVFYELFIFHPIVAVTKQVLF